MKKTIVMCAALLTAASTVLAAQQLSLKDVTDGTLRAETMVAVEPLQDGESYYAQFDLYWLSHIVYAESNGQPLDGMIGVGNVVLNRVQSERFPNSVQDVVFQPGQFNPVDMGTIYLEPSEQAILAAKLAIEGVNTVGESLYFVNPTIGITGWFNQNLTLTIVIADHAFYA
jgi:N-acetylmuramoyl-L-alanine amidase